ncbi:two-component regulator propeller domain-containing protein [Flammeovirga sp. SubArs3]|uniref:ligand-binding sensor domain-containing protein n=1 Tax=Flammeovirga sp. SubArs3 TaxID=2995316 RepID=UPI00248B6EE8|nr:two-component regulator propeller domain-containing protein [Flammeovirga sp. SubArs3]
MQESTNKEKSQNHVSIISRHKIDTIKTTLAPTRITRKIRKNKEGNLLITAFSELHIFDGETFKEITIPTNIDSLDAFDSIIDKGDNLWIGSTHFGVYKIYKGGTSQYQQKDGLSGDRVIDLLEDKHGDIWVATNNGISIFKGQTITTLTTKDGLPNYDVNTLLEDRNGDIWIGSRGKTAIYNTDRKSFIEVTQHNGEAIENVWSIIETSEGDIWIGGKDGLFLSKNNSIEKVANDFINCIYEDNEGSIWTVTSSGKLSYLSKNSRLLNNYQPREVFDLKVMCFTINQDKNGNLLIGSLNGIYRFKDNKMTYLSRRY